MYGTLTKNDLIYTIQYLSFVPQISKGSEGFTSIKYIYT